MQQKYRLALVEKPAVEPITVSEVKTMAHISHDVEDNMLASWIRTGRRLAEIFQRKAYITQIWNVYFDFFPELPVFLPRSPVQSLLSIDYTDSDGSHALNLDNFIIDVGACPARLSFKNGCSWPAVSLQNMNALSIRYIAGYGDTAEDVPDEIKDAIALYCVWRNENRAGEGPIPKAFYNLLRGHGRIYL